MADDGAEGNTSERTWVSWLGIVLFVAGALPLGIFFAGTQLPLGVRLGITIAFAVITGTIALLADVAKVLPDVDRGPVDWYTIAHCSAGLAFGAWFLPLWWVLMITIAWEMFEASVPGWGMHESIWNRIMDVTVAVFGWFMVAGLGALITHGHLPFLISKGSLACKACLGLS